jgi:hypothetical protein
VKSSLVLPKGLMALSAKGRRFAAGSVSLLTARAANGRKGPLSAPPAPPARPPACPTDRYCLSVRPGPP